VLKLTQLLPSVHNIPTCDGCAVCTWCWRE